MAALTTAAIAFKFVKSKWGMRILGSIGIILALLLAYGKLQSVLKERDKIKLKLTQSDNRVKELDLAYKNKDKAFNELKTSFEKMKERTVTTETRLPDGTVIITSTKIVESESGTTESGSSTETTVLPPPMETDEPALVRLPVSPLALFSKDGWAVGANYDLFEVKPPSFIPIVRRLPTVHFIVGGTVGRTWKAQDWKDPEITGVLMLQLEKRK